MAKIIALILLIGGMVSLFWGYHLSDTLSAQISQALTGSNSNREMMFYIGGIISFSTGVFIILKN